MNMTCRMDPYPCQTCWENKKKILKMQTAGMSDQAILASFQQDMGKDVVLVHPGILGSLSFYAAAAFGPDSRCAGDPRDTGARPPRSGRARR